jgi:Icc-related predicted phosphoesterase
MGRFICVSDTHGKRIPRFNGDVLLHAGDMTMRGTEAELIDAAEHIAGYPCRKLIVVPGNHDLLFGTEPGRARKIFEDRNITVLIDEETEAYGMKIYGSPWVPKCWGAFLTVPFKDQYENRYADAAEIWKKIPDYTDILITHGPARFILDKAPGGAHCGCPYLGARIAEVKPKFHVHGHIHCAYGLQKEKDTMHINAAILSERYDVLNPPIVFHAGTPGSYELW